MPKIKIKRSKPNVPVIPIQDSIPDLIEQNHPHLKDFFLSKEQKRKLLDACKVGAELQEAALWADIPWDDFYMAYKNNIGGIKFEVAKAYISNKMVHLARLTRGDKNWKPSAFVLERRYPKEFGREQTVNVVPVKKQVWKVGGKEVEF